MLILGINPSHDGAIAAIADRKLLFSYEAEKGSRPRFDSLGVETVLGALAELPSTPDVIATSGWEGVGAGYWGCEDSHRRSISVRFCGAPMLEFTSTHERAHLMAAYGMSPYPQGTPCHALVWEGIFGSFYRVDEEVRIKRLCTPMLGPGYRYALAYFIGTSPYDVFGGNLDLAGKLMALAAYSTERSLDQELDDDLAALLSMPIANDSRPSHNLAIDTRDRKWSFRRAGTDCDRFRLLAHELQTRIFAQFARAALEVCEPGLPLLISGGCGLNCAWNVAWRHSGIFSDVFVPPCCNDSGAAIGTAVDASFHHTGNAKIEWNVRSGPEFVMDAECPSGFVESSLDCSVVAKDIADGGIYAWVQGRAEIGPRALGARSVLAEPFCDATRVRVNQLKQREGFRPIAPVTSAQNASRWFADSAGCEHMMFTTRVLDPRLQAVTHVDGSARLQTLTEVDDPRLHSLLVAFELRTGVAVLANTSLNWPGKGFVNRASDLFRLATTWGIEGVVIGGRMYRRWPGRGSAAT